MNYSFEFDAAKTSSLSINSETRSSCHNLLVTCDLIQYSTFEVNAVGTVKTIVSLKEQYFIPVSVSRPISRDSSNHTSASKRMEIIDYS